MNAELPSWMATKKVLMVVIVGMGYGEARSLRYYRIEDRSSDSDQKVTLSHWRERHAHNVLCDFFIVFHWASDRQS